MSTPLTVNGITFLYPTANDQSWGQQATLWATAITAAVIPKAGGTFNLTGEVDFGTQYGLHLKSLRLNNADVVSWRNAANNADLSLTVNSSNVLTFNGGQVFSGAGYVDNLANATVPATTAGQPGALTAMNSNGKLNLVTLNNPTLTNPSIGLNTAGQIRQSFTTQVTGTKGDQVNVYYTFDSNPLFYGTASMHIPVGTTTQRVAASSIHGPFARDPETNATVTDAGSFRYNSDYKSTEYHDGTRWVQGREGDRARIAPQFFDDFIDPPTNWSVSTGSTISAFSSTALPTLVGGMTGSVASDGSSGSVVAYKQLDCNPTYLDYAEFRYYCTVGTSTGCGVTEISPNSTGQGVGFSCTFVGGNGTAHGTGNWIATVHDSNQTLTADTGVAVSLAPTFQTLRFEIGADRKTVTFFINGTQVAQLVLTSAISRGTNVWNPNIYTSQIQSGATYKGAFIADYALVKFVNIRN